MRVLREQTAWVATCEKNHKIQFKKVAKWHAGGGASVGGFSIWPPKRDSPPE